MKIVHTSDWHAGRLWKGTNRLDELQAIFEQLFTFIRENEVDLLLVSGDVFDTGAPSPEAERAVFTFLKRVGSQTKVQTILIAGNHDSPARIEAWGTLAELVGVHAVGRPLRPDRGGVREIITRSGEVAIIAALPFASARHLVSATDRANDETAAHASYSEAIGGLLRQLTKSFRPDAVNLVVAHTMIAGSLTGGSERAIHLGETWATTPELLPTEASYVALGHIHKPQTLPTAAPAEYAGSPLQMDFGEVGEEKSFVFVEAKAGQPVRRTRVPYRGGCSLLRIRATLAELAAQSSELERSNAWLSVDVPLDKMDPDLTAKVRKLLPRALVVRPALPAAEQNASSTIAHRTLSPADLYRAYHKHAHGGREPEDALVQAFVALYGEAEGETA